MDETDKKIRELTEAMRAERDIRISNRTMAVLRVLKGHSTKIASDFTNVDQLTVQLWAARFDEGGIGGPPGRPRHGQGFPCKVRADQETGRQACRQVLPVARRAEGDDNRNPRVRDGQQAQRLPRRLSWAAWKNCNFIPKRCTAAASSFIHP